MEGLVVTAAIVDVHYSVERFFNEKFASDYAIAYEGAPFRQEGMAEWFHVQVFGPGGQPSRASAYSASVRISCRLFNRTSQRNARIMAQEIEAELRGQTIRIFDESSRSLVLGRLKLQDPEYQPLPVSGGLHGGVLDVAGVLDLNLSS